MSVTLATIADALIEFILSLLRDPEAAAEFDADPDAALASRGLSNVSAADVCAVAPVIADRPQVTPAPNPKPVPVDPVDPVVREITNITNSMMYVDDRDTIVDQSVNQNIWANGDVTQIFDNEAVVASGDDAIAAGDDVSQETNVDQSTNISAGDDVILDSEVTETNTSDSYNDTTDTTTVTDGSTTTVVVGSQNESTATDTTSDSFNDSTSTYVETTVDTDTTSVFGSEDTLILEDSSADDSF